MIQKSLIATAILVIVFLTSCSTSKDNLTYFSNLGSQTSGTIPSGNYELKIIPDDELVITVTSLVPEATAQFNLPMTNIATRSATSPTQQSSLMTYIVDRDGYIMMPVLGKIKVLGMTRWECADYIKKELIKNKYLDDPIVTIEFTNFKVSVLGEVKSPGTYTINGDRLTILQAISLAGDLTLFGQRKNVSVIRENAGERTIYEVDLTSTSIFQSPAYYIKQNDIIYVEPTDIKKRQSTVDDKALRITSIALSSSSVLVSIATLISTLVMRNK